MTQQLTERQIHLLRHALGANAENKGVWGYRNRFFCADSTPDYYEWQSLVEQGFATLINRIDTLWLFCATKAGAKAAGLHRAAIKRAFEEHRQ